MKTIDYDKQAIKAFNEGDFETSTAYSRKAWMERNGMNADEVRLPSELNIDYTVRKTATKSHGVKLADKTFVTFGHYRVMLLGKFDLTYFHTVDLILDVRRNEWGLIDYLVKDVKNGDIRNHGTFIDPKDVSTVNKWAQVAR